MQRIELGQSFPEGVLYTAAQELSLLDEVFIPTGSGHRVLREGVHQIRKSVLVSGSQPYDTASILVKYLLDTGKYRIRDSRNPHDFTFALPQNLTGEHLNAIMRMLRSAPSYGDPAAKISTAIGQPLKPTNEYGKIVITSGIAPVLFVQLQKITNTISGET